MSGEWCFYILSRDFFFSHGHIILGIPANGQPYNFGVEFLHFFSFLFVSIYFCSSSIDINSPLFSFFVWCDIMHTWHDTTIIPVRPRSNCISLTVMMILTPLNNVSAHSHQIESGFFFHTLDHTGRTLSATTDDNFPTFSHSTPLKSLVPPTCVSFPPPHLLFLSPNFLLLFFSSLFIIHLFRSRKIHPREDQARATR